MFSVNICNANKAALQLRISSLSQNEHSKLKTCGDNDALAALIEAPRC